MNVIAIVILQRFRRTPRNQGRHTVDSPDLLAVIKAEEEV
jgi:hypothetical protein